jgi:hypothetical protein
MKKIMVLFCILMHHHINPAGTQEAQTSLRPRQGERFNVIFYGSLETHNGHSYDIEYITWDREIKERKVYEMPSQEMFEIISLTRNRLKSNPKMGGARPQGGEFVRKDINLVDIKKIEVPNKDAIWVYLPVENDCCEKTRYKDIADDPKATLYTEVIITDALGKSDHYLAERASSFNVSQIRRKDAQEIDLPEDVSLPAIKTLIINGYRQRDVEEEEAEKNATKRNEPIKNAHTPKKMKTAHRSHKITKKMA